MAVSADDLKLRHSGGGANSNQALSIGGAISSVEVSSTSLHNLFGKVTGDKSAAGDIEYRVYFVYNAASQTAENVKVYLSENYDSGVQSISGTTKDVSIGKAALKNADTAALSDIHTAPPGITFLQPENRASALDLGDMPAGNKYAIYLRREIAAGAAAQDNAQFEITIEADTGE